LLRLLNDILDFSKIESGKLDFEAIAFAPPPTVSEVVALLRTRAVQKRLEFALHLSPNLPNFVIGDAVRLKQVLLNLAGNAIKFTEQGRVQIDVTVVRHNPAAATVQFNVCDAGIGMDEAAQSKLFQVFSQGDSSMTRRFGGSGLGLAISQRLVNRMGGQIAVISQPGQGSTFSFKLTIPLGTIPQLSIRTPFLASAPLLSGHVLVVEDDRVNQRVIELLLEKIGLSCVIVSDGSTALEVATLGTWDAVLMDCQMPWMDGFEATRQIRRKLAGKTPPIIQRHDRRPRGLRSRRHDQLFGKAGATGGAARLPRKVARAAERDLDPRARRLGLRARGTPPQHFARRSRDCY